MVSLAVLLHCATWQQNKTNTLSITDRSASPKSLLIKKKEGRGFAGKQCGVPNSLNYRVWGKPERWVLGSRPLAKHFLYPLRAWCAVLSPLCPIAPFCSCVLLVPLSPCLLLSPHLPSNPFGVASRHSCAPIVRPTHPSSFLSLSLGSLYPPIHPFFPHT